MKTIVVLVALVAIAFGEDDCASQFEGFETCMETAMDDCNKRGCPTTTPKPTTTTTPKPKTTPKQLLKANPSGRLFKKKPSTFAGRNMRKREARAMPQNAAGKPEFDMTKMQAMMKCMDEACPRPEMAHKPNFTFAGPVVFCLEKEKCMKDAMSTCRSQHNISDTCKAVKMEEMEAKMIADCECRQENSDKCLALAGLSVPAIKPFNCSLLHRDSAHAFGEGKDGEKKNENHVGNSQQMPPMQMFPQGSGNNNQMGGRMSQSGPNQNGPELMMMRGPNFGQVKADESRTTNEARPKGEPVKIETIQFKPQANNGGFTSGNANGRPAPNGFVSM